MFAMGIFGLTGIKKQGESVPPLPGAPHCQNWILQHMSVFLEGMNKGLMLSIFTRKVFYVGFFSFVEAQLWKKNT